MKIFLITALLACSGSLSANEWSGNMALEYRQFSYDALSSSQFKQYGSVAIQPEWFHRWEGGKQSLTFVAFTRWDEHDEERTHSDIRELSWLKVFDKSELRVGLRKVFWGVSESQHLVDIINQTDLVENMDGEEKLGQPMINYALINDWGTLDLFILPYFRERTFPGVNGRLRSEFYVDTSNPIYESADKENHVDYAVRWTHNIGDWDIGLSHFNGTSRDPSFIAGLDSSGNPVLIPVYNLMQQTGLDLQATKDAWLWKMEVINRQIKGSGYNAATAGFEYTFYGVFESASDLGLVMEYLYDDRNEAATTPFEDDLMLGLRWTNNDEQDTSLLVGVIADVDDESRLYSLEASRRLGESWKLNLEARLFSGLNNTTTSNQTIYALRKADFVQLELNYYF
ncbi:MAG: hypothetical protein OEW99_05805 [Gammaproteobacteria bacterium]|nr:hypothetical protein [Gammaproteobacteria bacterium]